MFITNDINHDTSVTLTEWWNPRNSARAASTFYRRCWSSSWWRSTGLWSSAEGGSVVAVTDTWSSFRCCMWWICSTWSSDSCWSDSVNCWSCLCSGGRTTLISSYRALKSRKCIHRRFCLRSSIRRTGSVSSLADCTMSGGLFRCRFRLRMCLHPSVCIWLDEWRSGGPSLRPVDVRFWALRICNTNFIRLCILCNRWFYPTIDLLLYITCCLMIFIAEHYVVSWRSDYRQIVQWQNPQYEILNY